MDGSTSWDRSRVSLRFASSKREAAFWAYLMPAVPYGDTILIVAGFITFVYILVALDDGRDTQTLYRVATAVVCAMVVLQFLVHLLRRLRLLSLDRALHVSRGNVSLFVLIAIMLSYRQQIYAVENRYCNVTYFYRDDSRVYEEGSCFVFLTGWIPVMLIGAVQFKLSLVAIFAVLCASLGIIAVLFGVFGRNSADEPVLLLHFPFTVAIGAFALFSRYSRESVERNHFEAHARLEEEVTELHKKREEIVSLCRTMLPPWMLERASQKGRGHIDTTSSAAILCISIYDFAQQCTQSTPVNLAFMMEDLRQRIWKLIELHELHSLHVIQDQITAVGNVSRPMNVTAATYRCCNVGLSATQMFSTSSKLHLRAAVHVGPVAGGFIGRQWVRYDAVGEGLTVCRAAAQSADPDVVLLTDDALHECREHVTTREVGRISTDEDAAMFGGSITVHVLETLGDFDCVPRAFEDNASADADESDPWSLSASGQHPQSVDNSFTKNSKDSIRDGMEALARAKAMLKKDEAFDADIDSRHTLVPHWVFLSRFTNAGVENRFLDERVIAFLEDTSRTWLAFAWLVLMLFVLMVVDFRGDGAEIAAVMLMLGALMSAAAACFPLLMTRERFLEWQGVWGVAAVFIPLEVLFACAIARPSMVGNDMRTQVIMGVFVRSTCFRETKYQLIAKPMMLAVSHLQLLLPGGKLRSLTLFAYVIVLWSVAIDCEDEKRARRRFVVDAKLREVHKQLAEERSVREGLLRSTMPRAIIDYLRTVSSVPDGVITEGAGETAIMLVTSNSISEMSTRSGTSESSSSLRAASVSLEAIECALADFPRLALVSFFGDTALVVSPVLVPGTAQPRHTDVKQHHIGEAIDCALELASTGERSVLLESDDSLQITRVTGVPSFTVYGPGATRMLAVLSAVDRAALAGVVVTDRVLNVGGDLGSCSQVPLGRMKIRGAGILRLTRLASTQ